MAEPKINLDAKTNKQTPVPEKKVPEYLGDDEDGEEVEVVAQLSLPEEGWWGWVIVVAATISLVIVDGAAFTYGSFITAVAHDLQISMSLSSFINSLTVLVYYAAGPFASALINRFGFRACSMFGSIISGFALLSTYFLENIFGLCILYGITTGFGYCCVQMSVILVVGYYFEKRRAFAMAIVLCGSCVGVMIFSPLNLFIVTRSSWRTCVLMQSGLLGSCYFLALTFRPLASVTVATVVDNKVSRSLIVLPSRKTKKTQDPSHSKSQPSSTPTERLFKASSNKHFPTIAKLNEETPDPIEGVPQSSVATSSKRASSKLMLKPTTSSKTNLRAKQIENIKSRMSESAKGQWIEEQDLSTETENEKGKKNWFTSCCHWEKHDREQRPMYRDDAFYGGSIQKLPIYQSVSNIPESQKTGLDYQMAVSRVATVKDIEDNKGFFPSSIRRVLATLLDFELLKRWSFIIMCLNCFLVYLGSMAPVLFAIDRAINKGLDPQISGFLLSAINAAMLLGRLLLIYFGDKFNPLNMFFSGTILCGVSMILTNFYFSLVFQFITFCLYGVFASTIHLNRNLVLLDLYGLEKFTNATGLILLMCGIGCCMSGPFLLGLNDLVGHNIEFYVAGSAYIVSVLLYIPAPRLARNENANIKVKNMVVKKRLPNSEIQNVNIKESK